MSSINKVFLLGRLGKDPEVRYSPNGDPMAQWSMATSTYSTKNGQKQEYTDWHNVVAFNQAADVAGRYLHKGDLCHIEGSIRTRKWDDNGTTRYKTEVVVGRLTLIKTDKRSEAEEYARNEAASANSPKPPDDSGDDDIPF